MVVILTWQTGAHWPGAGHLALGIGPTWTGGAGVHRLRWVDGKRVQGALHKGITEIAIVTFAHRLVIDHSALGIDTAGAWAGIQTLLVNTSEIRGTFITEDTLRLALYQRVTLVGLEALTHGLTTPL